MPQECNRIRENLSAWLDGELPEEESREVAGHLAQCADCRREAVRLERLDALLESLAAPVPAGLSDRILARVRRPRPRWLSLALAASIVMGLFLGGMLARDLYLPPEAGVDSIALEEFHDSPRGSLGAVMVSYQMEEGNGS